MFLVLILITCGLYAVTDIKRCVGATTNLLAIILYSHILTGVLSSKLLHRVAAYNWHGLCALHRHNTNAQKCSDYYTARCHKPQSKQPKQYRLLITFVQRLTRNFTHSVTPVSLSEQMHQSTKSLKTKISTVTIVRTSEPPIPHTYDSHCSSPSTKNCYFRDNKNRMLTAV